MPFAALFLDRDGVINVDKGHVFRPENFEWLPDIFATLEMAQSLGLKIIVVTNQAGIAKGYYSEDDFLALTAWMCSQLAGRGIELTAVYHCPFHPEGRPPYRAESTMRKPGPGMLLRAAQEHDLVLGESLLIGDQETDVQAGRAAGLAAIARLDARSGATSAADIVVPDHAAARRWLQAAVTGLRNGGARNG